jgi:hypothetical protein
MSSFIYVDKTEQGTSLNRILSEKNLNYTLNTKTASNDPTLYQWVQSILENPLQRKKYTSHNQIDFVSHSGVMGWNTQSIANQVDFIFTDRNGVDWAVELKATMLTLKDAIRGGRNRITKSKERSRKQGYRYHLLICLPKDIDEQMTWMDRAGVNWMDWQKFRKTKSIPTTILKMENMIYAEPIQDWFLDEQKHISRYYQKQELILDWIRSKQ